MRPAILTALVAVMLALPAYAADAPAAKAATAGPTTKAKVAGNPMDPAKGAFHRKHTQKLKLGCDTCHDAARTDVLVVKSSGGPAPVNREACLSCHQAPAKPTWYGAAK